MLAKSLDSFIESKPGVCGGKPCIAGRRIRVYDVYVYTEIHKMSIDEIVADFQLTPQEVHAALAYYYEHRDEIDAQMAAEREYAEEMKKKQPSLLAQKRHERGL
jgi:uncharacterized protein (DUF433 family)